MIPGAAVGYVAPFVGKTHCGEQPSLADDVRQVESPSAESQDEPSYWF